MGVKKTSNKFNCLLLWSTQKYKPMSPKLMFYLFLVLLLGCKTTQNINSEIEDGIIEIKILQLNDVYEIAPLSGGTVGGMARVATVRKQLLAENPNVLTVLAGDFLNPSVIATVKYEGERIKGKQMVEVMNKVGVDLVTLGNHEFDLSESDLQKRIDESQFEWFSSNTFHLKDGQVKPFQKTGGDPFPETIIKTFKDADGTELKLGFLSVTLDVNKPGYVSYDDVTTSAKQAFQELEPQTDAVLAITHLEIRGDKALAKQLQGVPLFIGGHDHTNMRVREGNVFITKADANAKTVYIHTLTYNHKTKRLAIDSELKAIDETISADPETDKIVKDWVQIAYEGFKAGGIDPDKVVVRLKKPIDGKEDVIRHQPSIMATLVVKALHAAAPQSDAAILNTGSIRIDDLIEGVITQYDIVRILPYGGPVYEVRMKGKLLTQLVDVGLRENVGIGGYLALDGIQYDAVTRSSKVNGKKVETDKEYRIAMPSFLLTGQEQNLDFLTPDNPAILEVIKPSKNADDLRREMQLALIDYLEKNPVPKKP